MHMYTLIYFYNLHNVTMKHGFYLVPCFLRVTPDVLIFTLAGATMACFPVWLCSVCVCVCAWVSIDVHLLELESVIKSHCKAEGMI